MRSRSRAQNAPEIPTVAESALPGFAAETWFGIVAPAGTPRGVVNILNTVINASLSTPEMQETITRLGALPQSGPPEEFVATIATQFEKWRALGKAANIKID